MRDSKVDELQDVEGGIDVSGVRASCPQKNKDLVIEIEVKN